MKLKLLMSIVAFLSGASLLLGQSTQPAATQPAAHQRIYLPASAFRSGQIDSVIVFADDGKTPIISIDSMGTVTMLLDSGKYEVRLLGDVVAPPATRPEGQ